MNSALGGPGPDWGGYHSQWEDPDEDWHSWGRYIGDFISTRESLAIATEKARRVNASREESVALAKELEKALELVVFFADDNNLWEQLRQNSLSIDNATIEKLNTITAHNLEPLIQAFGYKSPPPPSAQELVSQTQIALAIVTSSLGEVNNPEEEILKARKYLKESQREISQLLQGADIESRAKTVLITTGNRLGVMMNDLLVPAIAAGAAAGAAGGLFGNDMSTPMAEGVKELTKTGVVLAAGLLVGSRWRWRTKELEKNYPELSALTVQLTQVWMRVETLGSLAASWRRAQNVPQVHEYIRLPDPDAQWQPTCTRAINSIKNELIHYLEHISDLEDSESARRGKHIALVRAIYMEMSKTGTPPHPHRILRVVESIRLQIRPLARSEAESELRRA